MTVPLADRPPATLTALPRSTATRRVNRTALTLLGLVLVAAGVVTLLAGAGVLRSVDPAGPVLPAALDRLAGGTGWFWPVVAAGGVVLALLALRWLVIQVRSNHLGDIAVESERSRGETVLSPRAVTGALEDEIEAYHGVAGASCSLRDHHGRTLLLIQVRLDGRVDVDEVRAAIEDRAVAEVRQVLDDPELAVRIEITISPRRVRRTR